MKIKRDGDRVLISRRGVRRALISELGERGRVFFSGYFVLGVVFWLRIFGMKCLVFSLVFL